MGKVGCLPSPLLGFLLLALFLALTLSRVCRDLGPGQPTCPICQLGRFSASTQKQGKQLGVPHCRVARRPQAVQEHRHPL